MIGRRILRGKTHSEIARMLGTKSRKRLISYLKNSGGVFIELRHLENFARADDMPIAGMLHELAQIVEDLHPSIQSKEETAMADSRPGRRPKKLSGVPGSDERAAAAQAERERATKKKPVPRGPHATP